MKMFLSFLIEISAFGFFVWLWTLVWNYGVVVLLAHRYAVPTLDFIPAFFTGVVLCTVGIFITVLYMLMSYDVVKK